MPYFTGFPPGLTVQLGVKKLLRKKVRKETTNVPSGTFTSKNAEYIHPVPGLLALSVE